ncbi:hypothetical protein ACROYT_G003803 [Oculina patagonica]
MATLFKMHKSVSSCKTFCDGNKQRKRQEKRLHESRRALIARAPASALNDSSSSSQRNVWNDILLNWHLILEHENFISPSDSSVRFTYYCKYSVLFVK